MKLSENEIRERPSQDEIARLAYQLYETRGRQDGQDVNDWLSAEQELTRQLSVTAPDGRGVVARPN